MPAQRTEQIAENLRLHICQDLCARGVENCACRNSITAALTRAREAGAEAMRERAAIHVEQLIGLNADVIRALPLTKVIPDGK